jgi:hypothetical protein
VFDTWFVNVVISRNGETQSQCIDAISAEIQPSCDLGRFKVRKVTRCVEFYKNRKKSNWWILYFIYLVNNSETISSVLTKRSDQSCSGEFLCVRRQGGPGNNSYKDHFASSDSGVTA